MAVAGSCPSGAQIVRNFGLLRAAQSDDVCVVNWLVRSLPADWPARCPASTPVPNREPVPLGRRAEHAWIADSVQALHRRTAGSALADQCAPTDAHRQGWCGRGHVPTPAPSLSVRVSRCTLVCQCAASSQYLILSNTSDARPAGVAS
jgi:hypothetical protein